MAFDGLLSNNAAPQSRASSYPAGRVMPKADAGVPTVDNGLDRTSPRGGAFGFVDE